MINVHLADRLSSVQVSATVAISARAGELKAAGRNIISLSAGEPDFDTPSNVIAAAKAAMDGGETRYTLPEGIIELRQAVCDKLERDNNLCYQPDEVIVCSGGKQVLFNALLATLNPGDEVLIPAPYWVSYPDIVRLFGGQPVFLKTTMDTGFKITPPQLAAAITPKTRWILLNSPSNPTGSVYSRKEFRALGDVLQQHPDVWVITDDIYEKIIYDDAVFASFADAAPALKERTLTMNGVSKSYAMTGWRLGYAAANRQLIAAMKKIQGQSTMAPCSIAQWAAAEALSGPQEILVEMNQSFDRRRLMMIQTLNNIAGLTCYRPEGAFYLFVSIRDLLGARSAAGTSLQIDTDWVMALMEEQGVALVPGSAFGAPGYFRLSYAASESDLTGACERIASFCAGLTAN